MMILQLLAACAVGALLMYGYLWWRGFEDAEVKRLRAKLTAKESELAAYKSDVQEHFLGTAKAVDALTIAQQDVFAQLERGAQHLVGDGVQDAFKEGAFRRGALTPVTTGRRTPEVTVVKADDAKGEGSEPGDVADLPDTAVDDVLDNPASAAQRLPSLTPSRN